MTTREEDLYGPFRRQAERIGLNLPEAPPPAEDIAGVRDPSGTAMGPHIMSWTRSRKSADDPWMPYEGSCSCGGWKGQASARPSLFEAHDEHIAEVTPPEPEDHPEPIAYPVLSTEWCVRLDNGHVIGKTFSTREEARDHLRAQRRLVYGDPSYGTVLHLASRYVTPWKDED